MARNSILLDQVKSSSESQAELKMLPIPENLISLCFQTRSVFITIGNPEFVEENLKLM